MKKFVWLLCMIFAFSSVTSCSSKAPTSNESKTEISSSENVQSEQPDKEHIFSLPYFSDDSLNPYNAKQSANFYLGTLLYDPLFKLDKNFNAVPVIADKVTQEGNDCTVTLKSGLKFSDGSTITAQDVAASFKAAKNSAYYSARLKNAASCTPKGNSVNFALKSADINFIRNLNFPIIKGGSNESRAIGSGRYTFNEQETPLSLSVNENSTQKAPKIKNISLVEIHKYSTLPHMVKIGSVNFVYATSGFDLKTAAAKTSPVLSNNLIYLGINGSNTYLANQDFRKAISLVINRKAILSDAYANSGYATAAPFHPQASYLNTKDYAFDLTNTQAAAELFAVSGLTEKNENNIFIDADSAPVILSLAVNKDNPARLRAAQSVKLSLEATGIGVTLIEEETEAYKARVSAGDYDLFIGEVKLTPDNDISPMLTPSALNLCDDGGETLAAYNKYLSGEMPLTDFLRTFDLKTPFIPIMYKNSTAVFSGTLSGNSAVTEYDVFADMENWIF